MQGSETVNPIDLSLEELRGFTTEKATPAPKGTPSCRVVVLPDGQACGAIATLKIVWSDGDVTLACVDCADRMATLAQSHKTTITIKE